MTYYSNVLNQISGNVSHYVVEVVVVHIAAWFPEADISISSRVLGIGLEFANFPVGKLQEKPWVFRPEQPDIGDGIEDHSDALEPKSKSPTHFVWDTCKPLELKLTSWWASCDIPARSNVDCKTTPQPRISSHLPRKRTSTS